MESIQRTGGSADCDDGLFSCFKDCCVRTIQFCNSREKRCQDCSLRQAFCGKNQTLVPSECDLYCYKQQPQHLQTCQSEWIFWSGWIVAAVLVVVIIGWGLYKVCKSSSCFHKSSSGCSPLLGSSDDVDIVTETQERENVDNTELKQGDQQIPDNVTTVPESRLTGINPTTPESCPSSLVAS